MKQIIVTLVIVFSFGICEAQSCSAGLVKANRDTICMGTPVHLSDSSVTDSMQWQWADKSLMFTDIPGATNYDCIHFLNDSNIYYFRVVTHIDTTCYDTSNVYAVTVLPSPVAQFTFTAISYCHFKFNSSGSIRALSYKWDFGDSTTSDIPNPEHIYTDKHPFQNPVYVCLELSNNSNCWFTLCRELYYVYPCPDGVSNISESDRFIISSNPCTTCEIRGITNERDIIVTDLLGKALNATFTKTSEGFLLNLPNTPSGIYFVKDIKSGRVGKFVKE